MVSSVNNGIPQQIPAATAFKPGEVKSDSQNKESNFNLNETTSELKSNSPTEIDKFQETSKNLITAKDHSKPSEELLSPPSTRGSRLDITV